MLRGIAMTLLMCALSVGLPACSESGPAWTPIDTTDVRPRWGHVALIDARRDRMLVLGGENERGAVEEVLSLDLETLTWSAIDTVDAPIARTDFAAILDAARDRVITVGGRQGFSANVDWVRALDLSTNTWSALPSGPAARHDVSAATDGEHLWVFGGAGELWQSRQDLWELDLRTDTWRQLPDAGERPSARTSYACAYHDGALYYYGGHDAFTVFHDVYRYDLGAERWERVTVAGGAAAGAHFGQAWDEACSRLLITAGDNLDNFNVAFTEALVLGATPRFERIAASALAAPRDHPSLALDPVRRRLILFGGGIVGDGLGTLGDAHALELGPCP